MLANRRVLVTRNYIFIDSDFIYIENLTNQQFLDMLELCPQPQIPMPINRNELYGVLVSFRIERIIATESDLFGQSYVNIFWKDGSSSYFKIVEPINQLENTKINWRLEGF